MTRHRDGHAATSHGGLAALTIGAAGIVYGDIGTSPLYALDQIFYGHGRLELTPAHILGALSLVVWTLTLIVAIKYAVLVLRAHNDGEGGVFALYGLLHEHPHRGMPWILGLLVLGAGLLFGDGVITPAISVLSAVEGVGVATPGLAKVVVPVTIALLTLLFAVQAKGTAGIGRVFGPVLIVWFVVIAALGAVQVVAHPQILAAVNPAYGLAFLRDTGWYGALVTLGALMLVVTGGEAMYADLGHFGARPIRLSWFALVFPCLLLSYLGQGAYLLGGGPVAGEKIFFSLVPHAVLYPMVLLATVSTVIASQALISGAFSLTSQAIGLGLLPKLLVRHTHHAHAGQIYIPVINWMLYVGCVLLVLVFGSSGALASTYGLAVSGVMLITSISMFPVSRLCWKWSPVPTLLLWVPLTLLNGAFLAATSLKLLDGGFVPMTLGMFVFIVMTTWRWGRKATFAAYASKQTMTVRALIELHRSATQFLERPAVLMSPKPMRHIDDDTPALLQLLWDRYGVLPRHLIFVHVTHRKVPHVHDNRYAVRVFDAAPGVRTLTSVEMSFGFMEEPNVERALAGMARHHEIALPADPRQWVVHVSHENLLPSAHMGRLARLRFRLFLFLRVVSRPAYYGYGLGDEVQLSAELMPVRVK